MHQRKWHASEKRPAREPEHHGAVLPDRPEHAQAWKRRVRFAKNPDASRLELIEDAHPLADLVTHVTLCAATYPFTVETTKAPALATVTYRESNETSARSGASYGSSIPVTFWSSPLRARAYK